MLNEVNDTSASIPILILSRQSWFEGGASGSTLNLMEHSKLKQNVPREKSTYQQLTSYVISSPFKLGELKTMWANLKRACNRKPSSEKVLRSVCIVTRVFNVEDKIFRILPLQAIICFCCLSSVLLSSSTTEPTSVSSRCYCFV